MQIMEFTYTKSPADVSSRVFIPLVKPTDKYFGIDVSDLDVEDQALIANELDQLNQERSDKIETIMAKYDVRTNYRSFIPSKMSDIVDEG